MVAHPNTSSTITVSLTQSAHRTAETFCQHQSNFHKAEQVYLNTLAIYAVKQHLQHLGFSTDWEASDSWDMLMQTFVEVADLQVKNYGKLECRFVLPSADVVYVPEETWQGRIGYIAVCFNESLTEATLLGFIETIEMVELPLSQLRSIADLPKYLNSFNSVVNLKQWFGSVFDEGWQTVESLLSIESKNLTFSYRETSQQVVKRTKSIDWKMPLEKQPIALLVAVLSEEDEQASVRVQVHPIVGETYLPVCLKLSLLSESGEILQEVISRAFDNFIQLPYFRCSFGEIFSIQVTLDDVSVTERFLL